MSFRSPAELLAFLQEQEFLTPRQVQQLSGAGAPKFADLRALGRELIVRDWLTPYQVNQLLQGRSEDLLLGPYRLIDQLGAGGMGQVFKAHHVRMDRIVALKMIPKDRVSNPMALARFYREVRAVAKLSHPNIVVAFEVNQVGETPFLAMENVEGIDLGRLVLQSGPLPIPNACEYIRQAAVGLQHAHEKGLVHRDIKPSNLMVARSSPEEPPVIKILDFGLARFESEQSQSLRLTQLGSIVGTLDYIAPEQAENSQTADIRADIYSLGCSLFYLLTGHPPFPGEHPVEKIAVRMLGEAPSICKSRPEVSPELERVLARMMTREPADRYQTPSEVAQALEPFADTAAKSPSRKSHLAAPPPPPPRSKGPDSARTARSSASLVQPVVEHEESPFAFASATARTGPGTKRSGQAGNAIRYGWLVGGVVALLSVVMLVGWLVMRNLPRPGQGQRPSGVPPTNDLVDWKPPREIINSIGMKLVLIPAGKFKMGSPMDEKERDPVDKGSEEQHEVEITKAFYLGVCEVTQGQFKKVMGYNPSFFSKDGKGKEGVDYGSWPPGGGKDKVKDLQSTDDLPVENVSRAEAQTFLKKLSEQEEEQEKRRKYRLPTEAEWEYACRAGTSTPFSSGTTLAISQANFGVLGGDKGALGRTSKVGSYKPNAFGLFDMHCNVWEWCQDWYDKDYYARSPRKDPPGAGKGSYRVLRGGAWDSQGGWCRSAIRFRITPDGWYISMGFRAALVPSE